MEARKEEHTLIGQSPNFLQILEHVSQVGVLDKPVLIIGERGTGKELIAERLHYLSGRWDQTFIKLNCAALPETLLETELFGHEAGAFTSAGKRHAGRFERAERGSLFLDEVASMSMRVQEKLLRIIEYGEYERVGGNQTLVADVRIIGAANVDLPEMAKQGKFREDLLDRLSFDVITIPPLRARPEDISLLADHFAVNMVTELRREYFPGFTDAALDSLAGYPWPGNVRELKNVVERAVYKTPPEELVNIIEFDPFESPYRLSSPHAFVQPMELEAEIPPRHLTQEEVQAPALPYDFKKVVSDFEVRLLKHALESNRHNQRKTAQALDMTYHQLRGYLRKYGMAGATESNS